MEKIVIGSRGSSLSTAQTNIIAGLIRKVAPEIIIETRIIITHGDLNQKPIPLDSMGKGFFTKEIDLKLISGEIGLAVHSLKDLPEKLAPKLTVAAICARQDPREVLVSKNNIPFEELKKGSVIGTDSQRRKAQVLHLRPDLVVKSIRGNVDTRIKKLENEGYNALILAAAGLIRLNLKDKITQYLNPVSFIPSPGQGALAVTVRKDNKSLLKLLSKINDKKSMTETNAERAFSLHVGGGCKMPTAAYALINGNLITLHAMIASKDGKNLISDNITGPVADYGILAKRLAEKLLHKGKPWYNPEA